MITAIYQDLLGNALYSWTAKTTLDDPTIGKATLPLWLSESLALVLDKIIVEGDSLGVHAILNHNQACD
jgi:hypothetical protein